MRRLGLLLILIAGCGAPPNAPTARRVRASRAPSGDGCPAAETRLGESCWSAEGTRWQVEAEGPGGAYRFELELMAANRARSTDHTAAGPQSDEWVQDGPLLRILLSHRFVEYRARLTNGTVLIGEARNVRGQRWSWRAARVFGELSCPETETRVGEACMSVAGTRWRLEGDGLEAHAIAFLGDGQLGVDESDVPAGSWTQRGSAVTFALAEHGPSFEAEVSDADALEGTWTREGSRARVWRATRLESFPPVMHR